MPEEPLRPANLPDFTTPPLNEVVLGVQFMPARGYQQIRAGEVWSLFRSDFPFVEEHPPIAPIFETFGPSASFLPVTFGVVTGAQHDRFWFLSTNKDELIQFQQDRLLHNWRKVGDRTNRYPRFEAMSKSFESEIRALSAYFNMLEPQAISCNQVEISYINHINLDQSRREDVSKFVNFVNFRTRQPDDFSVSFRETIIGKDGTPIGRLFCDLLSSPDAMGGKMYVLNLTVRGAPSHPCIEAALDFLKAGRDLIVNKFVEITTESAHALWGRRQ